MADEKVVKEGSTRQKLIAVVVIIVLIVVVWQVWGMFGTSSTPTPTQIKPTTTAMSATMPAGRPTEATVTPTANAAVAAATATPVPPPPTASVQPAPVASNELLQQQQQLQNRYINLMNDLQILKIQRDIAETNQAIAASELAKVTSEKGISDLLTKPSTAVAAPTVISVPPNYGAQLGGPPGTPPPPVATGPVPPPPVAPVGEVPYTVISVSMRMNRWTALLGYQNRLFSVAVGDVLPLDGSKVAAINRNGVTLKKDNKRRKISILTEG